MNAPNKHKMPAGESVDFFQNRAASACLAILSQCFNKKARFLAQDSTPSDTIAD
jgi:hypothetical protein